jgi:hypothetical protein
MDSFEERSMSSFVLVFVPYLPATQQPLTNTMVGRQGAISAINLMEASSKLGSIRKKHEVIRRQCHSWTSTEEFWRAKFSTVQSKPN